MPKLKLGDKKVDGMGAKLHIVREDLRQKLYSIPGVESVYVSLERDYIDVWIMIPQRDVQIMEQTSIVNGEIIEMFSLGKRSPLLFDFHVIYRNGRDEKDLVSDEAILLPK